MKFAYEIPKTFWGLFRSGNREIYIEALLTINEEYQYNNYFLSKESCRQIIQEMCMEQRFLYLENEEEESIEEQQEAVPSRILNWLIKTKWLRKVEDYTTMTTNIVIPDYAAVMIEAFEALATQPIDDTELYIQNVYATLFSFKNDNRMNLTMLRTALLNTKKLNKTLQDMLHNMDKFFESLLDKTSYVDLLKEHLNSYVDEVVRRKYHILKTSDNFYMYKMDIKRWIKEMREDEEWIQKIRQKQEREKELEEKKGEKNEKEERSLFYTRKNKNEDVLDLLDQIERGFDDIEHRISNMDKEHNKYIKATVSRLNYLLSDENERHGMLIQLLNHLGNEEDTQKQEEKIALVAQQMNLSLFEVLSENPLYKRKRRKRFEDDLEEPEKQEDELSKTEILQLNQIKQRYTKQQIEEFLEENLTDGKAYSWKMKLENEEAFEKLILAYDLCIRKNSRYKVIVEEEQIVNGCFRIPKITFIQKLQGTEEEK